MKKYLTIIKTVWQRNLTYRFTIISFRIGEMGEMVIMVFMWSAIFSNQEVIRGFTLEEMLTYVLVGNLIDVIVRNWLPHVVATDIKDGRLSAFLLKPLSYFTNIILEGIGRTGFATIMSVISQLLVMSFFLDRIIFNFNLTILLVMGVMIVLALFIELYISFLVGMIAFWTDEVMGLHQSISRLKKIFAGGYFPISMLSPIFVKVSMALPFAYSFYVPTQLYLGKIDLMTGIRGVFVQTLWLFLLYVVIKVVWRAGIKRYEGVGI